MKVSEKHTVSIFLPEMTCSFSYLEGKLPCVKNHFSFGFVMFSVCFLRSSNLIEVCPVTLSVFIEKT
jgi:hypothetical protein